MNLFFKLLFLTIIGLVVIYYFMKRQEEIPNAPRKWLKARFLTIAE